MEAADNRADRAAQVRAQVAYHGQRLALYQRLHGSQPSARLAELEHAYTSARARLAGASEAPPEPRVGYEEARRVAVRPPRGTSS